MKIIVFIPALTEHILNLNKGALPGQPAIVSDHDAMASISVSGSGYRNASLA
jgi:hypothetical protein